MLPLFMSLWLAKDFLSQLYLIGLFYVTFKILDQSYFLESEISIFVLVSNILVLFVTLLVRVIKINKFGFERKSDNSSLIALFLSCAAIYLLVEGMGGSENLISSWLIIKGELENNNLTRLGSMLSYCFSVGFYFHSKFESSKRGGVYGYVTIFMLFLYAIAIKVKLFIIPVVFAFFYPRNNMSLNFFKLLKIILSAVILYLIVMMVRWSGDLEGISFSQLIETLSSVGDAGVEKELLNQSSSVFQYYQNHDANLGQSIRRILELPFYTLGIVNHIPENPMYEYYAISNGGVYVDGGSAHPGIYADSYAEWKWLGVIFPGLYLALIRWVGATYTNKIQQSLAMIFVFISVVLLIRGSTYYGYLYALPVLIISLTHKFYKYVVVHTK